MSSGRVPEYTMLTPLPLTPDVMPHEYEQLVSLGLTIPCELVPHYTVMNMLPTPIMTTPILENEVVCTTTDSLPARIPTSPEVEDHDEVEEDEEYDGQNENNTELKEDNKDPFSPNCKIPLPAPFSPYAYWLEPSFIRRRNERERQRVRNVNDGFERLKNHLPMGSKDKDKRLSKVEILRMAIKYIRSLQDMLKDDASDDSKENMACSQSDSES